MGVRIDKARQDDSPAGVDHLAIVGNQGFDFVARANALYPVVAYEQGAVFDDRQLAHFGSHARPRRTGKRDELFAVYYG